MEKLSRAGLCFYGIGLVGIGIQQFIYSAFRPMLLPFWLSSFPGKAIYAYITGAVLILGGILVVLNKKVRVACLALGICFFLFFLYQAYKQIVVVLSDEFQLAAFTNPLKALAFSGGALIIAASLTSEDNPASNRRLLVLGKIFFCIMLIVFGINHFLYAKFVVLLIPKWIPGPLFWTYFAAVALIGSGIAILFNIKTKLVAFLCGIMIFCWLILLHIPRAIAYPDLAEGNEITSAFQALAFSGIAFLLSRVALQKKLLV